MLERDPQQRPPTAERIANLAQFLTISREDLQSDAIDELLSTMGYIFANGGAQFASFLITEQPDLAYFAARDQLDEISFWHTVLQMPAVLDELPWLGDVYPGKGNRSRFEPLSTFYLDGDVAQALVRGGAYIRFPGTAEEAKQLSWRFCSAVFGNRFDEVITRSSRTAWASWFMGLAWDYTWLGLDRRDRRLWILCATDTD